MLSLFTFSLLAYWVIVNDLRFEIPHPFDYHRSMFSSRILSIVRRTRVAIPHPTSTVLPSSSQAPTKRWNRRFRAQELDSLWENYYKNSKEKNEKGPGEVSIQSDEIKQERISQSDELVAWGDFELQPFVEILSFPDIAFDKDPKKIGSNELGIIQPQKVGHALRSLLKSTGVSSVENKEFTHRNRHVKRTKARRARRRTEKFGADQKSIRRLLWLIDKRREYEKAFNQLEDHVVDPYGSEVSGDGEFWMKWAHSNQVVSTQNVNPCVEDRRR